VEIKVRQRAADTVASHEPGGLLYGAVVTAGSLAAVSINVAHVHRVALAVVAVLVCYWLAHVYVATQHDLYTSGSRRLPGRLSEAAGREAAVLWGGIPAVVVYCVSYWLLGVEAQAAALVALWFSIGFLVLIGYLGAHRAGMRGWVLALEAAGAGSLGLLAVLAKLAIH